MDGALLVVILKNPVTSATPLKQQQSVMLISISARLCSALAILDRTYNWHSMIGS